jgi:hypothetical protein
MFILPWTGDRTNNFEPENYWEYPTQKLDHEYEPHKALLAEFSRVIR